MTDPFEGKKPDPLRLRAFGFRPSGEELVFGTELLEGQFRLTVHVRGGEVKTELIDAVTGDPYVLHLVEEASGAFVGRVREEYGRALDAIAASCFESDVFQSDMTQALISFVREKYGDEPEYLWKNFPDNAIWRRKDNAKWYGVVLTVERKKAGMPGEGRAEVLDVRAEPQEAELLVDRKKIFPAWHMNKRHWILLPLDGSLSLGEIAERLEESYFLAGRK